MKSPLGSMITAMVTPFAAGNGRPTLDLDAARDLAVALVTQGSDGLVLCGSTGEGPTITAEERRALVKAVADAVDGRAAIIANVGTNSTATTIEAIEEANDWPIDGVMVVVPFYNKPPQEGIYRHFAAAAKASTKPIVAYNIPSRTGVNMDAETTLRLAREFPTIAAVKEASGRGEQVQAIINGAPEGFAVLSGDDEATLGLIRSGASGVISTIGNIAPNPMRALVDAALAGDFATAQSHHDRMLALMRGLFETTNPILVKEALRLRGLRSASLRLPLIAATSAQSQRLQTLMEKVDVPLITLE